MDRWRKHFQQGPAHALIAACLLAGVFAMHGLTGSHDAAIALTHQMPATAPAGHSAGDHNAGAPTVHADALQPGPELTVQAGHDGHLHAMGDVCLAMLAALLLALVVTLALRGRTVAHPVVLAAAAVRVATDGPSPPWRRPTLSKLCVLRT